MAVTDKVKYAYSNHCNLALQGYSRAHRRGTVGDRWLCLGGVWDHTQPNQTPIRTRASPETNQRAMRRMVRTIASYYNVGYGTKLQFKRPGNWIICGDCWHYPVLTSMIISNESLDSKQGLLIYAGVWEFALIIFAKSNNNSKTKF